MREITLTKNKTTRIDEQDYHLVSKHEWCAQQTDGDYFYAATTINAGKKRKRLYLRRLLLDAPKGLLVAHRDGDTLNNQRGNLHLVPSKPRAARSEPNGVNYIGVQYVPKGVKHWRALITIAGERTHLGVYESPLDAAKARDAAAIDAWGEYAVLNLPKEASK